MKDYLTYRMMGSFGVDAPLCSYAYITVNGGDWGLYLAVEGVEEAFLQRNYGNNYGNLYKPDSSDMGAGPGNGRNFDMNEFMDFSGEERAGEMPEKGIQGGRSPENGKPPEGEGMEGREMPDMPERFERPENPGSFEEFGGQGDFSQWEENERKDFPGGFMGMGSSDVKLQYLGDDSGSYPNIFDNAKTDIGEADKARLISSLKALSEGSRIEEVVDVEEVLRYFVVHNFVCNGDSYTGSIVHNYYLYEEDGQLSMIPWDYNLAFSTFQSSDATSMVNSPIDTPVSGGRGGFGPGAMQGEQGMQEQAAMENEDSRPMVDWIFAEESYTRQYHQYFADFLESMDFDEIIDTTAEMIAPYVEKDPTKFYTCEEFETGAAALKEFCRLRKESVKGQLSGSIPADSFGQAKDSSALVDASHLNLSDMGTMEKGGEGFGRR